MPKLKVKYFTTVTIPRNTTVQAQAVEADADGGVVAAGGLRIPTPVRNVKDWTVQGKPAKGLTYMHQVYQPVLFKRDQTELHQMLVMTTIGIFKTWSLFST